MFYVNDIWTSLYSLIFKYLSYVFISDLWIILVLLFINQAYSLSCTKAMSSPAGIPAHATY